MCLFSHEGAKLSLQAVTQTGMVWSKGLFNPFTMSGQLVVNGVLASSHSDWFLDSVAEKLGFVHLLPSIYQTVLAPGRWMYQLAGKLFGDETTHKHMKEMQANLNKQTSNNEMLAPFFDAASRFVAVAKNQMASYISSL